MCHQNEQFSFNQIILCFPHGMSKMGSWEDFESLVVAFEQAYSFISTTFEKSLYVVLNFIFKIQICMYYLFKTTQSYCSIQSEVPKYFTWQKDKMFRSIVLVKGEAFSSQSWEKNKRYSEQGYYSQV